MAHNLEQGAFGIIPHVTTFHAEALYYTNDNSVNIFGFDGKVVGLEKEEQKEPKNPRSGIVVKTEEQNGPHIIRGSYPIEDFLSGQCSQIALIEYYPYGRPQVPDLQSLSGFARVDRMASILRAR